MFSSIKEQNKFEKGNFKMMVFSQYLQRFSSKNYVNKFERTIFKMMLLDQYLKRSS